jgi:hypothetical protein
MGNVVGNPSSPLTSWLGETQYTDGDVPRDTYTSVDGSGYAYYRSSKQGRCSICGCETNHWYVTSTSKGMYLCKDCNFDVRVTITKRPKTYGTM